MSEPSRFGDIVCNPYSQKNSSNRKGLMVHGEWDERIPQFLEEKEISALYFNDCRGWRGEDFSFLQETPWINELDIISGEARGLEAIKYLCDLRNLSLECHSKSSIDFGPLTKLEKCYISFWKGANSIFQCSSLTSFYIDDYKNSVFPNIEVFPYLRSLTISNSTIKSLDFLEGAKGLIKLNLLNCRGLENFDPLSQCNSLEKLTISGSKKMADLGFLKTQRNLKILDISDNGDVLSIAPLGALKKLKAIAFDGTTNVLDGELGALCGLPKLAMLMFRPRRHYSHKLIKEWDWGNFDSPDKLLE